MTTQPVAPSGWQPIETAPKDRRVLVWSGREIYTAHWVKNIFTDEEAWVVAEWGNEGDQALVNPILWHSLPTAPQTTTKGEE